MKDIGSMMSVALIFMSIYYLILFFKIEKCINAIKHIEKKLDSIRPSATGVAGKREGVAHD